MILVPGSTNGTLLKSWLPNRYAWKESMGLIQDVQRRLSVRSAWSNKRYHLVMGSSGGHVARHARK